VDETPAAIQQQIVELEAELADTASKTVRRVLERELVALREQLATVQSNVHVSDDATIHGPVTGINQGTIQVFFAGQPSEDGKRLLRDYLHSLHSECQHLRLHRLTGQRQTAREGQSAPALRLQQVYTGLTTDGPPIIRHERTRTAAWLTRLLKRLKL
jgi:hypothetical protein